MRITVLSLKNLIIIYQVPVIESTEKEYWIRYQKTQLLVLAKFINHVIFVESLIPFLFYLTEFLLRPNAIISQQGTGGNELI